MRVAIISDIHGNYPALCKVIEDAHAHKVDKFVFIGDYIFDLPFSNEVADLLMGMEDTFAIKGNKEEYLDVLKNENQDQWTCQQMGAVYQTYRELSPAARSYLMNLEEILSIPLDSNAVLYATHFFKDLKAQPKTNCSSSNYHEKMLAAPFTHGDYLEEFQELINSSEYKQCIDKIDADIIVFGHNHLQAYGYCGDKLIVNPGSCGQPLDFNNGAAYTILDVCPGGVHVLERRVPYDVEVLISAAKSSFVYQNGRIWGELVFLALRTGRDYFGKFFAIASEIAKSKNQQGQFFMNDTWNEAYDVFVSQLDSCGF